MTFQTQIVIFWAKKEDDTVIAKKIQSQTDTVTDWLKLGHATPRANVARLRSGAGRVDSHLHPRRVRRALLVIICNHLGISCSGVIFLENILARSSFFRAITLEDGSRVFFPSTQ